MSSKATVTWPHISAATKCEEPRYHRRGLQHRSPAPRTANEDCVMRTEKDKMLAGDLYDPAEPELQADLARSEEHTSELQALMRISFAAFCLKKNNTLYYTTSPTY